MRSVVGKINFFLLLGAGYVAVWIAAATADVGTRGNCGALWGWDLPLTVGIAMGIPLFLGYYAGREAKQD